MARPAPSSRPRGLAAYEGLSNQRFDERIGFTSEQDSRPLLAAAAPLRNFWRCAR